MTAPMTPLGGCGGLPYPFSTVDENLVASGHWFAAPSQQNSAAVALTNNQLRLIPWRNITPITVQAVAVGVSAIGDVASVIRLGVYLDDGTGKPGQLFMELGTCPTDTLVVTPAALANVLLPSGLLHVGGAIQGAGVTPPTMFCNTQSDKPAVTMDISSGANPTAAASASGYQMAGVAGALPQTFVSAGPINASTRLFFRKS